MQSMFSVWIIINGLNWRKYPYFSFDPPPLPWTVKHIISYRREDSISARGCTLSLRRRHSRVCLQMISLSTCFGWSFWLSKHQGCKRSNASKKFKAFGTSSSHVLCIKNILQDLQDQGYLAHVKKRLRCVKRKLILKKAKRMSYFLLSSRLG